MAGDLYTGTLEPLILRTLEPLILRTLPAGPIHGYGILHTIEAARWHEHAGAV